MMFGLDWDGTFTEDPELWRIFVTHAKLRGHDVTIITTRDANNIETIRNEAHRLGIEVLPCNGLPKIQVADEAGILVHVWIDDMPGLLFKHVEY